MNRIAYFDQMKGLAMILVVIGHIMLFAFKFNPSEPSKFIYFNMPMFFYVSGFLAYKESSFINDQSRRLMKRGMTLLIPYVVFLSVWCLFSGYSDPIAILLGGGGRYWFLYTLFIISTFFLIYEYVIGRCKNTLIYVTLLIVPYIILIATKVYLKTNGGGGNICEIITGLVNYYRYFLIGYICRKYIKFNKLLFCTDVIAALGLVAYFLNWFFFEYHNILFIFGGSMGAIITIQRFFEKHVNEDSMVGKTLSSIGRKSLAVYVIHYFFIPDVSATMHDFLNCGNPFIWQLTFAFLLSIPIVAASMLIGKLIETNTVLNFLCFGKPFWNERK